MNDRARREDVKDAYGVADDPSFCHLTTGTFALGACVELLVAAGEYRRRHPAQEARG